MSSTLDYKGYTADIVYDAEGGVLAGSVLGVRDGICFEAESAADVESAFHEAVDDYLEFCAEKGKEPEVPYKGSFNVRISPDLHRAAAMAAIEKDESLNRFVADAIAAAV